MRKRGFYDVDIIADWENIVGPQWAKMTSPHKLNFNAHTRRSGTLHILVAPGANVLLLHVEQQIIDRVNTHFGFEAVNRLKLMHGHVIVPVTAKRKTSAQQPLPEIEGVKDPDLKAALQGLGQSLAEEKV